MDGRDGANRIPRMGRWTDTWTHWKRQLRFVSSFIGYVHHSDDSDTGNDVLHYDKCDYSTFATRHDKSDADYIGRVLVVREQLEQRTGHCIELISGWNCISHVQGKYISNINQRSNWNGIRTRVYGYIL
jgi:hypothetical protein